MDILAFPVQFPRNQPSFNPNFFDVEHSGDYLERLKEREARLEARKKALCYGGKDDNEHHDAAGSVNRNDYPPPGGDEDVSEDDDDMHSTSSHSFNEASEGQEDDVDDEIPFDDSEVEEVIQAAHGNDVVFDSTMPDPILHPTPGDNPDEVVEEDEVVVGWADIDTDEDGGSSQSDA